jgi:DNA-binding transcriptional ArsR family regulator
VDVHPRHLRILSGAGFVRARPDGPRRLYSLRAKPFRELDSWMGAYRGLWDARLDRLERALELEKNARLARKERPS